MAKRLFSILTALLLVAGAVPSAWAALDAVGVSIAPHGYPAWYQDGNGLKLELCVPPPAGNASRPDLCVGDPLELDGDGNPLNPLVLTGESFWWMAQAQIPLGTGAADLTLGIEGTFGGAEAPVDGQQISFGRTRIRIDTPVAGTYKVIHPYATQEFVVVDPVAGINYTADIGAANFLSPAIGFNGTLAAPIGPFLTWPGYASNPALQVRALDPVTNEPVGPVLEQYVGNPNIPSPVVGGPNGNVFRVEGPTGSNLGGPGINFVETDLFNVMGKVFDPTIALVAHVFPGVPAKKLHAVGPVNRETAIAPTTALVSGQDFDYAVGYPIWYQENLGTLELPVPGVQLTLCTPGDAMCISDPIALSDDAQAALRTGGEGFWWSADARFDTSAGRALLVLGLEATFGGDESLQDGQQISFGRERIRIDTPAAGTYRVTHPYGQRIFENVPAGDKGINFTADVGIADPVDPDGAFVGALYSDIGPTFLKWTTFVDPATLAPEALGANYPVPLLVTPNAADPSRFNYHVGNPGVEHAVVGSPMDPPTNFFRVERLVDGEWELVGETDLFAVSGKIYDPATFEFAVNPNAPVATADADTLNMAAAPSRTVNVTANDTVTAGFPVTITIVTPPDSGTAVANNPAGTITYTPDADFALDGGIDTFSYQLSQTINNVVLTSGIADVTVTVVPVETITVNRALFNTRNLRLDFRGTSNFPGTSLTIHAGAADGPVLGTVLVDVNGRWNFRGTSTANVTSVTLVSNSAGATSITQPLQVR